MAQPTKSAGTEWLDQASKWMQSWNEQGQVAFQKWAENWKGASPLASAPGAEGEAQGPLSQLTEVFNRSMAHWAAASQWPRDASGAADAAALKKLFDPSEWGRAGTGGFDLALEHLTEGPTYATLWDLDRKLLHAQKLSQQRLRDIAAYQAIVQDAWRKAGERFFKSLSDPKGPAITSGRELLDLWITTANNTLVEMHRTDKFLEAQRNVTRSSTDYRLAERAIAESFCEVHHIPTRSEVDELQKTVVELRRELRALRSRSDARSIRNVARTPARKAASKSTARRTKGKK
jgi:hypothetical protein